jgi:tRNA-binding EMAP/Myf-like protein
MLKISKEANENYLAKIIRIQESDFRKHTNADKLKCVTVDFQNVITGIDNPAGIYVYFPLESQISDVVLSNLGLYRESELNVDKESKGFFEKNRRVKAIKLRGEYSQGFILPISDFATSILWQLPIDLNSLINTYFDTVNDNIIVQKYVKVIREKSEKKGRQSKMLSRLVDGQVHLHEDTDNLRKCVDNLQLDDNTTISYKLHGTSGWASNVLVKRKLSWFERLLKKVGVNIQEEDYDIVYGSRRVVKNKGFDDKGKNHYYSYDLWKDMVDKYDLKTRLPKGFSIYYEIVGFTKHGTYIQKDFDYKCKPNESKIYVYRVTFTNRDGIVYNLNDSEAKQFTEKIGLEFVPLLYMGFIGNLLDHMTIPEIDIRNWRTKLIKQLENLYNEKDCFMCNNQVPEEGIVLRKVINNRFESYKLKSARFLMKETKDLDEGNEILE